MFPCYLSLWYLRPLVFRGACHWSLPLRWLWWHLEAHRHQTCLRFVTLPPWDPMAQWTMGASPIGSFPFIKKVTFHWTMTMGENGNSKVFNSELKKICGDLYLWHLNLFCTHSLPNKIGPMFQKLALCPRSFLEQRSSWIILNHHDMRCKKKGDAFHLWSTERGVLGAFAA